MLFGSFSLEELRRLAEQLEIAKGKLLVAKNALEKHRTTRGINMLSLVSAMHGVPFNYRVLGGIYIASSEKDVVKVSKRLRRFVGSFKKKYPGIYPVWRGLLERVEEMLSTVIEVESIDEKIRLIDESKALLSTAYSELRIRISNAR